MNKRNLGPESGILLVATCFFFALVCCDVTDESRSNTTEPAVKDLKWRVENGDLFSETLS